MKGIFDYLRSLVGGSRTGARRPAEVRFPGGVRCHQCGNPMAHGVARCARCGARKMKVLPPSPTPAAVSQPGGPTAPPPTTPVAFDASHLELGHQILIAAITAEDGRIHAMPTAGDVEGEVKAGSTRLYGGAALEALEALVKGGLVRHVDNESTLVLTADGRKTALELRQKHDHD